MLFKIAWRNLWRNRRRSLIVLTSIIVGIAALLLNDALGVGMMDQMLNNQINSYVSHIQIHKKGFNDNKVVRNYMAETGSIEKVLKSSKFVKNYSKRVITFGLLSSPDGSSGVSIVGVEPEKEAKITTIKKHIIKGKYLTGAKSEVVIGKKMAEKLGVELGDKVVAIAAALDGSVSSALFRVSGIYQSFSSDFDKTHIFISLKNAQKMLGLGNKVDEIIMLTDNPEKTLDYKKELETKIDGKYEILAYQDLLPIMMKYIDIYKAWIIVFYVIISIAVIFGIINTMLMSVLERINEIGVLMSIGMKNFKIFIMVLEEALLLGVFGTVIGVIVGLLIYWPFSEIGLNLAMFSEGLDSFGLGSIIYPRLNANVIINSLIIMPFATVLGAVYPAIKAIKLQPTDAMRHV